MKALHKINDILLLGLHSLGVHKVRSALTALGIFIGVCGVIAMLAINEGAGAEAQRTLRALGSTNIIIESRKPPQDDSKATGRSWGALNYGLTKRDVTRITGGSVPHMRRYVTVHQTKKMAYLAGKNLSISVIATDPTIAEIVRIKVQAGRFITSADMLRRKPHCVITAPLVRSLFGYENPLGKTVRIGGEPFVIVGMLSRLPQALSGEGAEATDSVIIPRTTGIDRFGELTVEVRTGSRTYERVEISRLILQMEDENAVLAAAPIIRSLLERNHDQEDYDVKVPLELIEQKKKQMFLWNVMLVTIASVSLLVGGIGIMNIMLATVVERTREIGVRRALGAKQWDIIAQFLVEAVTLTTVGGVIGIGAGISLPWLIRRYLEFPTETSVWTILLPFLMAVSVGLISGIYPAMRAAKLDPITALRHE